MVHSESEPDTAHEKRRACKIGRSPILGQILCVLEDAIVHREPEVTGEAL